MASPVNLLAIVGPTASGKTALALDIAERYGGEIICADSRTIYKGMDIGTAKPTAQEQARVQHWGLDLVEPNEPFSAADFKKYATEAIADIRSRGKLPLLVGGTGLYVDAVLYDFTFGPKAADSQRQELESWSLERLQDYCVKNNILLPENRQNKRYVVRAIERHDMGDSAKTPLPRDSHIVGIATSMDTLRTRIIDRSEHIFGDDIEREATLLGKKYGWDSEAMTGNVYPLLKSYLDGEQTLPQVKDKFATIDYRLAKRQMTWFRRNPDIMWTALSDAPGYVKSLLVSE